MRVLRHWTVGAVGGAALVLGCSAESLDKLAENVGRDSSQAGSGSETDPLPSGDGTRAGVGGDRQSPDGAAQLEERFKNLDLDAVAFPAGVTVASPVGAFGGGTSGPGSTQPPPGGQPPPPGGQLPPPGGQPPPYPAYGGAGHYFVVAGGVDAGVKPPEEMLPPPDGPAGPPPSAYTAGAYSIAAVLEGVVPLSDEFRPGAFFRRAGNALCYGPNLDYRNHPDDPSASGSGQLPGGDLGIWNESTPRGEACAAAQMNARMHDVEGQVHMALLGLAGLVAAYNETGQSWPDDVEAGSSVDLSSALADVSVPGVVFGAASMALGEDGATWSYGLELQVGDGAGASKQVDVSLQHKVVDEASGQFEGLLNYRVEDTYPDRACRQSGSGDVTVNGSVHYSKSAEGQIALHARNGTACGHASATAEANLLTEVLESEHLTGRLVSPTASWADNFSLFTANFQEDTQLGSYTYAWQAGSGDSHTRVLNLGLTTEQRGEAFFGYGDRVQDGVSGAIRGFICNWAGPGNNHGAPSFSQYAQGQVLERSDSQQHYVATESHITYAPTNSCTYDGTGTFAYDRNLDRNLDDETPDTLNVMPTGTTLPFALLTPSSGQANIEEYIASRGYSVPAAP